MGDKKNDSSILGSGHSGFLHVVRSRHSIDGYKRNLRYGLGLYLLLAIFSISDAHAAETDVCGAVFTDGSELDSYTPNGDYNCTASTSEASAACGHSNILSTKARCTLADTNGDWEKTIGVVVAACASGWTEVNGECIEDVDPCDGASADNFSQTNQVATNPGLCNVGDTAQATESICTFSETALESCNATITSTYTYAEAFPEVINLSQSLSFSTTSCSPETNPVGPTFTECEPPPPTCPEGTYAVIEIGSGNWICQIPSDDDTETPPEEQTHERETTTTSTSTTTNNPDGSTTTTTTTTTELGDCPPGEVCTEGLDYEGPGDLEVKTFAESLEAFWDSIQTGSLVNAVSGIGDSVPESSSCPTWSIPDIPVIDTTLTIDAHCDIFADHETTIRSIFLIVFALIGVFIVFSA